MTTPLKLSRRRWIAETDGCDIAEYSEHQPSLRGAEKRLPIYSDGTLAVCQLPGDSAARVANTLDGREWTSTPSWRDASVIIHRER